MNTQGSHQRSVVAERFRPFGTTIFTEMTLLANAHGAVNLAQGFPDFDGPEFIKRAAVEAMGLGENPAKPGQNQYARMFGIPTLNRAIAESWRSRTGQTIDPDTQVTVTSGCTEALAAALLGMVNPGDEVILFEPYYDSYIAGVAMAGGVPRVVTLRPPAPGSPPNAPFAFDPEQLRAAFSPKTRVILVNTPHNPTGKVFSREELSLIAELCIRHDTVAITDEVYEYLTYNPSLPHVSLASLPEGGMAERTLTCSSLGKSFSLTGWKIGWTIGSTELNRAVRAAHQFLTFATATPLQHGAAAAVGLGDQAREYIKGLLGQFSAGRTYLGESLERLGFRVFWPAGAYFIMVDWTGVQHRGNRLGDALPDDAAFCRWLTQEIGVAAIPPSVFYTNKEHGRNLARFAFCKKRETLEAAVARLERLGKNS